MSHSPNIVEHRVDHIVAKIPISIVKTLRRQSSRIRGIEACHGESRLYQSARILWSRQSTALWFATKSMITFIPITVGCPNKPLQVLQRAEIRMNAAIVRDGVRTSQSPFPAAHPNRVYRHEPYAGCAEITELGDSPPYSVKCPSAENARGNTS